MDLPLSLAAQAIGAAALLAGAAALALNPATHGRRRMLPAAVAAAVLAGAVVFAVLHPPPSTEAAVPDRPVQVADQGYVSSDACRACHPRNHATWQASYHRRMTQVAGPESVIGRFDGAATALPFRWGEDLVPTTFRALTDGRRFAMEIERPPAAGSATPGERRQVPIALSTGSHHMQFYWFPTGRGRSLSLVPLAWLKEAQRWVPRETVFLKPHTGGLDPEAGRWNRVCVQCHTTHPRARVAPDGTAATVSAQFGIACEACHGPGAAHVAANRDPLRRYTLHLRGAPDPTIVNPARLAPGRRSEVCGQCHGIWAAPEGDWPRVNQDGWDYRPGQVLADSKLVLRGRDPAHTRWLADRLAEDPRFLEGYFWPDGMVRVSGREYNGLLDSPCYADADPAGPVLSCLSCHRLHRADDDPRQLQEWADDQLDAGMRTNRACVQCHEDFAAPEALAAHTGHAPDSAGSLCYDCHMPYTTYGLLKAMRSHTVSSPSVQETLETGRPNACNQCHLDRTLAWTAGHLRDGYGIPAPALDHDQQSVAASVLWALAGDAGQRALAAWSMGRETARAASGGAWVAPHLIALLDDPYPAVRYIAARSLRSIPEFADLVYDFLAPQDERRDAQARASALWHEARPGAHIGPALALATDGLPDARFAALLGRREDRVVNLQE